MKTSQQLKQCIWLIETIYQAESITFKDIRQLWKENEISGGLALSRTTFNRLRDAAQTIFGVIIECNVKGGYHYYIFNREEIKCKACSDEACAICPINHNESNILACPLRHCLIAKIK